MKYLEGNSNHLSFPDTNHNVKNFCYQLLVGYFAAVIGLFCFDPWLINMSGVAKLLIQFEDFSSDAVVLRLKYSSTTKKGFF